MPFINERIEANREQNKAILAQKSDLKKTIRASRFRFEPGDIMLKLRSRIVGQEQVLSAIENMLYTLKADFSATHRPLSIMFFLGPTGVGKTETARILAEAILGSPDKLCRIDMNTLAQEHYSAAITGSPPGYVGSKEGTTLFNSDQIQGTYSLPGIVLFDEIEKADRGVVRAILNIFDTGKLTLSSGMKELDFSNSLIFMTSNLGVKSLIDYQASYQKGWRRWLKRRPKSQKSMLNQALNEHFDPEFLNRIDQVVLFESLDDEYLDALVGIELSRLNQRLGRCQASITLADSVRTFLTRDYDQRFGARDIARRMRLELEPVLARALISHPTEENFSATMTHSALIVLPSAEKGAD